jgi:hypothetical protein
MQGTRDLAIDVRMLMLRFPRFAYMTLRFGTDLMVITDDGGVRSVIRELPTEVSTPGSEVVV